MSTFFKYSISKWNIASKMNECGYLNTSTQLCKPRLQRTNEEALVLLSGDLPTED